MQIYNIRSLRIFKGVYWERYFLATIPGESIEIFLGIRPPPQLEPRMLTQVYVVDRQSLV